jgi:hypothetical protein
MYDGMEILTSERGASLTIWRLYMKRLLHLAREYGRCCDYRNDTFNRNLNWTGKMSWRGCALILFFFLYTPYVMNPTIPGRTQGYLVRC